MKNLIQLPVLFENDFCIVLNKPSGLAVQGGEGIKHSLDSILSQSIHPRPFLVHRLDRDTSGLILVAKTKEAAAAFSALFAGKEGLVKIYLGICSGIPSQSEGLISLDLEIKGKPKGSKKSMTIYRLLSSGELDGFPCSQLELELGTGRMHQIRRHLALIRHPLLGDDKYGNFSLNKKLKKSVGLKNLLLHANRLVIPPMPCLPAGLEISAPPPEYFPSFT